MVYSSTSICGGRIAGLLLGKASGGNHAQPVLVGKAQNRGNFIRRTGRDRYRREQRRGCVLLQSAGSSTTWLGSANRAQLSRKAGRRARGAHIPSCASTGFRAGPEISRHMRGVGSIFSGFSTSSRVERVAQADHHVEVFFGEQHRHQVALLHANAVLAGDGAADVRCSTAGCLCWRPGRAQAGPG